MKNYIYAYIEPRPNNSKFRLVRYVGKGETVTRLLNFSRHLHGNVGPWIKELAAEGYTPVYQILETTSLCGEGILNLENEWTEFYKGIDNQADLNCPNVWPPNTAGKKLSEEHKIKISKAKKGKSNPHVGIPCSNETRAKMSKAKQGKVVSDEARAKISKAKQGHIVSEETRTKISKAHKDKVASDEARAKMSKANKGKVISEETKAKMSKAKQGKVVSEETKAKISASLKGNIISEETRAKMSKARQGKHRSIETRAKISITLKNKKKL